MEKRWRTDEKLGDEKRWIGNFITWMDSEEKRGRITKEEKERLLELNKRWMMNPDPMTNKEVKKELTDMLRDVCWRTVD